MAYPLAALQIKPSTFDPVGVLQTASQLQGQQSQNELAKLRMTELQEQIGQARTQRGALEAYGADGGVDNPAALRRLSGHPDLLNSALGAADKQRSFLLQEAARGAQRVMAFPEGRPERTQAYQKELDRLRQAGAIDDATYNQYASQEPKNDFLNSIIRRAMPLSDKMSPSQMMDIVNRALGGQPETTRGLGGDRAPLSVRTNNPGAITMGRFAMGQGANGATPDAAGNPVARFDTPEQGAASIFRRLSTGSYVGMPLGDALSTWWTGQPGRADPRMIATVAQRAGLRPDTPITPELLAGPQGLALARAMAQHEAGRPSPLTDAQWTAGQRMAFGEQGPPRTLAAETAVPGIVVDNSQQATTTAPMPEGFAGDGAPPPRRSLSSTQLGRLALLMSEGDSGGLQKFLQEVETGGMDANQRGQSEARLRDELEKLVDPYRKVRAQAERLRALVDNSDNFGSGAGDVAMVFSFVKALDPGSTVSPGEQATAANTPGVTQQIREYYNRILSGKFLSPEARRDMVRAIELEVETRHKRSLASMQRYEGIARRMTLDPTNIVDDDLRALPWQRREDAPAPPFTNPPTSQPTQQGAAPPVAGARQAPDGHWYTPDPQRPGKFLRVDQ